MRKLNFKSIFIPTISLFIICICITLALSVTNAITKDKIAQNEAQAQQESMQIVCPDAANFELVSDTENGQIYVATSTDGNVVGYAISTVAAGYGGQIKVMTGVGVDDKIINIDVYYNDDETPGLGKNTSNADFTSQYSGLVATDNIVVDKDYSGKEQQVSSVTSATISSRAVTDAVNNALALYNSQKDGGEQ